MVSIRESLPSFSRPAWATGEHGYQKLERAIAVAVGEGFLAGAREGLWWRNVATASLQLCRRSSSPFSSVGFVVRYIYIYNCYIFLMY